MNSSANNIQQTCQHYLKECSYFAPLTHGVLIPRPHQLDAILHFYDQEPCEPRSSHVSHFFLNRIVTRELATSRLHASSENAETGEIQHPPWAVLSLLHAHDY